MLTYACISSVSGTLAGAATITVTVTRYHWPSVVTVAVPDGACCSVGYSDPPYPSGFDTERVDNVEQKLGRISAAVLVFLAWRVFFCLCLVGSAPSDVLVPSEMSMRCTFMETQEDAIYTVLQRTLVLLWIILVRDSHYQRTRQWKR